MGMTFLEIIMRKHPFENKTLPELEESLEKEFMVPETVPEPARALLQEMLRMPGPRRITMKEVVVILWLTQQHEWFKELIKG